MPGYCSIFPTRCLTVNVNIRMTGIVTIDKKDLNITMEIFPQIPQKKKKASVPVCHQIVI